MLLAAWPLLGMRLSHGFPWAIRPVGAIVGTVVMTVLCLWFLAVWANPSVGYVGLVERFAADLETLWPVVVVTALATYREP